MLHNLVNRCMSPSPIHPIISTFLASCQTHQWCVTIKWWQQSGPATVIFTPRNIFNVLCYKTKPRVLLLPSLVCNALYHVISNRMSTATVCIEYRCHIGQVHSVDLLKELLHWLSVTVLCYKAVKLHQPSDLTLTSLSPHTDVLWSSTSDAVRQLSPMNNGARHVSCCVQSLSATIQLVLCLLLTVYIVLDHSSIHICCNVLYLPAFGAL